MYFKYINPALVGSTRLLLGVILLLNCTATSRAVDSDFIRGADISLLPVIEKAGVVFQQDGKPGDAIQILNHHGCNLYRVRLFVDPNPNFNATDGAVQDLSYVRILGRRIKAAGGIFLLDIHYSDTWADPAKQATPREWSDLSFDALQQRVHDYTAGVLKDLQASGASPDMVQVGNEIASGILWPQGKVLNAPPEQASLQWERFSKLENAGAKAVREAQTAGHPIRVMLHIHGGGRAGLPRWFFGMLDKKPVDYDIIGLSFYPAWGDSIDALKQNMNDVILAYHKDVLLAETSYPWREMEGRKQDDVMRWPMTPAGQKEFLQDITAALKAAPEHHGIGFVWWYPEAVPCPGLRIWRRGAEALFDSKGNALPAMDAFGPVSP